MQKQIKFDVILCVGYKDVFFVKKTVFYVKKNLSPQYIYLIVNRKFFKFFSTKFKNVNNVILIDENKLENGMTAGKIHRLVNGHFTYGMRSGWYLQQFLKMAFANSQYASKYYLIWDADTIPTSHIEFFDNQGRMLLAQKTEYHKPYFSTMKRLIGLSKSADFSFIAEHMMVETALMRELIDVIKGSNVEGKYWYEKIINATNPNESIGFSEFETYGTFLYIHYPHRVAYRKLHTMRNAGYLFGRFIKKREIDLFDDVTDTISVEPWHLPHFPRNVYQKVQLAFLKFIYKMF